MKVLSVFLIQALMLLVAIGLGHFAPIGGKATINTGGNLPPPPRPGDPKPPTKGEKPSPQSKRATGVYPGRSQPGNPGNIQDLHILAHRIMPRFYDGIELDYAHRLASNKIVTANWVFSHTRPSGFRFGGIYTMVMREDFMRTPTIIADINPSTLSSNAAIQYFPFENLRFEASMQRAAENIPLMTQMTLELLRPCATITANLYNARSSSGRGTLSFMRSLTDHLAIGAELLLEWNRPKEIMADTAFAARYTKYNSSCAASASRQGLDVSYWQRLNPQIQMASMFAWHRKTEKTIATICYQWEFEDAIVRGMFDSDLSVGFMYYRTLTQLPLGIGLSLLISLPTNRFIFGLKFNLDPSGLRRDDMLGVYDMNMRFNANQT